MFMNSSKRILLDEVNSVVRERLKMLLAPAGYDVIGADGGRLELKRQSVNNTDGILIQNDSNFLKEMLKLLLVRAGYEVISVEDGKQIVLNIMRRAEKRALLNAN